MTITLKAEERVGGKAVSLREKGIFPAVFYGRKEKATPIQMKQSDFIKIWKNAGESTVVTIELGDQSVDALINEVDLDPVTGEPRHADFYVFEKGHKVEISVPIEFEGVSPAVKELGAVLVKALHELKIKADPAKLPHEIIVDISSLAQFGDSISAGELKLPPGVELMENLEEMVVNVSEPKEEKEEEVVPIDLSQIEVEKKGKDEEEAASPTTEDNK